MSSTAAEFVTAKDTLHLAGHMLIGNVDCTVGAAAAATRKAVFQLGLSRLHAALERRRWDAAAAPIIWPTVAVGGELFFLMKAVCI